MFALMRRVMEVFPLQLKRPLNDFEAN